MIFTSLRKSPRSVFAVPPASRAVLLSGPHPRVGGGVVAHCLALEEALAGLGVEVRHFHVGAGRDEDGSLTAKLAGAGALVRTLPSFARATRGRLVHLNPSFTPKSLLRDAALLRAARLSGARVVVEFHGGMPGDVSGRLARRALSTLCQAADSVVVLTTLQRDALLERAAHLADKLHVIPNGVTLPSLDVRHAAADRQRRPRLLFLSRLLREKGVLDAIRAMTFLDGYDLDVAGDGPALTEARDLVETLGLQHRVTLHGRVGGETKKWLLREASMLVFPSYYPAEGLPIVLLEAFAWGLPIVTCDVPPISFLVGHDQGRLVAPREPRAVANAVAEVLASPSEYTRLSVGNRALAEREYDLNLVARRFLEVYRTVGGATASAETSVGGRS